MPRVSFSYTLDPPSLDPETCSILHTCNAETSSSLDDVAIACGQATYEHDEGHSTNMWSDTSAYVQQLDDFPPNQLDKGFTRASQSHHDITKGWDNESFSEGFPPQFESYPPTRGKDPWNHLQTFAPGASLGPGSPYTSSRTRQTEALSESSSSLGEVGSSFEYSYESRNSLDTSALQQKTLYETESTQGIPLQTFPGDCQNINHQLLGMPLQHRFGRESIHEEEKSGKAHRSFFHENPSMSQNQPPVLEDSRSSVNSERDAPYRSTDNDHDIDCAINDITYGSNHLGDESLDRDLMGQSWQYSPLGLLNVPMEPSWPHVQELNPTTREMFYSVEPQDHEQWEGSQQLAPASRSTQAGQTTTYDPATEGSHDCSGAIQIPGSSKRYDAKLTSSFPPTAGHFPTYVPTVRTAVHNQAKISDSQPTIDFPKRTSLPMRRKTSKPTHTGRPRSTSLKVIPEQPTSLGSSPTGSLRGRRKGHLDRTTALAAGLKRSDGTVCIRCKVMKQTCEGDLPCEGCQRNSNARSWGQPCHKAKFVDMIESGPCNAIFQKSASLRGAGQSHKISLEYHGGFDLQSIIDGLLVRESDYNIRVSHFSGSSYTLDLAKLRQLMSAFQKASRKDHYELDDFGGQKISRAPEWLACVTSFDQPLGLVERSVVWNNMPSRNDYFYLPLDGTSPRPMTICNDVQKCDILLAVHLCRIVLRALEVSAFRTLQREINELPKNRHPIIDIISLSQNLENILFSLRWRISWWAVFGISSSLQHDLRDRYTERVSMLTQTLYFWYFVVKKRLLAKGGSASKGLFNSYADATQPVYEDFPHEESIDGFHAWMARGPGLIYSVCMLPSVPQHYS